jgi:hypothetical protein
VTASLTHPSIGVGARFENAEGFADERPELMGHRRPRSDGSRHEAGRHAIPRPI